MSSPGDLQDTETPPPASDAMLRAVEELIEAGSFKWDIADDHITWSPGLYRLFGLRPEEFPATLNGYLERVHPDDRDERRQAIAALVETGGSAISEHRILRPNGEVRWIATRLEVLSNREGSPDSVVGACRDITESHRRAARRDVDVAVAWERASRDPLTGISNRTLALDRLEQAYVLARQRGSGLAVLFIDVDGFKEINDRHGHGTGDRILKLSAERIQSSVRGSDTVARIGGDEFLVICEEPAGELDPDEVVQRIRSVFAHPARLEGYDGPIELSIGVSVLGDRELGSSMLLIEEADSAMYEAKRKDPGGPAT
jgi:diguanylate cyclase (GGDEF)-like protein/PAS domain S-box-containing protein